MISSLIFITLFHFMWIFHCMYGICSVYSWISQWSFGFPCFGDLMDYTAVDISAEVLMRAYVFLSLDWKFKSRVTKPYVTIFNLLRSWQAFFHTGCLILHFYQQYLRVPLYPHPPQHLLLFASLIIVTPAGIKYALWFFQILCLFWNWFICISITELQLLMYFNVSPLSHAWFTTIFISLYDWYF